MSICAPRRWEPEPPQPRQDSGGEWETNRHIQRGLDGIFVEARSNHQGEGIA